MDESAAAAVTYDWQRVPTLGRYVQPVRASTSPETGSLRWDQKQHRWVRWTGQRWAKAVYAADQAALAAPQPLDAQSPLDDERRAALFRQALAEEVLADGTVVQQERLSAVLSYRRPVHHGTHALLTLLTLGAWSIVWIVMAIARKDDRIRLEIDSWGNVWPTETAK